MLEQNKNKCQVAPVLKGGPLSASPDMDRTMVGEHLAMAERHVEEGIRHVEQQRALVATLARDGHDVTAPRALLTQFEELLRLHVADRDRLRAELAQAE